MLHNFGFILAVGFVYVCGTIAGDISAPKTGPHPGFFKLAIGRRVNDDTALFDHAQTKLEAQDLPTSYEAMSSSVVARADHLPSTAAPAGSIPSGTARFNMHQQTVPEPGVGNLTFDYSLIQFGTPPQELMLDVSTAGVETWVVTDCNTCSDKASLFNKTASTSYVDKDVHYTIKLSTENLNVTLSEDVVAVQGLSVRKQAFGVVSGPRAGSTTAISGVLCIGFGSYSTTGRRTVTFIQNLIDEKRLAQPIVSIHLARPGRKILSEACFGCVDDEKRTGSACWVPLIRNPTRFDVPLTGLSVNNNATGHLTNITALISTSTRSIILPQNLTKRFYDMIPGAKLATEYGTGYYKYPCNSSLSISITLGVSKFLMNGTDFNLGPTSSKFQSYCLGGVRYRVTDPPNAAVIGNPFLRSWYSTFNYQNASIGFSPSINNK